MQPDPVLAGDATSLVMIWAMVVVPAIVLAALATAAALSARARRRHEMSPVGTTMAPHDTNTKHRNPRR